jgi:hypothetical protein
MTVADSERTVAVRLLNEPPLWCWEVREGSRIVTDSWSADWQAYDSRGEAEREGLRWLASHA